MPSLTSSSGKASAPNRPSFHLLILPAFAPFFERPFPGALPSSLGWPNRILMRARRRRAVPRRLQSRPPRLAPLEPP